MKIMYEKLKRSPADFISVPEFAELHNICANQVYSYRSMGKIKDGVITGNWRETEIDNGYYTDTVAFTDFVYEKASENYEFLNEFISKSSIARLMTLLDCGKRKYLCYASFMTYKINNDNPYTILKTKPNALIWDYFRFSNWIVRIVENTGLDTEDSIAKYIALSRKERACFTS